MDQGQYRFLCLFLSLVASFKGLEIGIIPNMALNIYSAFHIGGSSDDPNLQDVYNAMDPPMTPDQWHIHDPSRIVATEGMLMIADTGKENADGYK